MSESTMPIPSKIKASDFIVRFLYSRGVEFVFEVIGGMTTHLMDSLHSFQKIKVVSMHHEQSASFAVDVYGRSKGIPCVAMATSGPGATNLITGIGSCFFDSSPGVFITGQVNTYEQKGSRKVRQSGFQETDIVSVVSPICKGAWKIDRAEQIPEILERAFDLACEGRPGPVLIDIPMDLQRSLLPDIQFSKPGEKMTESSEILSGKIADLLVDLRKADRPLILAGGGIRASQATDKFRELTRLLNIPVVYSLMGVDALGIEFPQRLGMIGSYGNRWANLALGNSDFLIVLGSRLDIRQTGSDKDFLTKNRTVWHLDCDVEEINSQVKGCKPLVGNLSQTIPLFIEEIRGTPMAKASWENWLLECQKLRETWPDTKEITGISGINPNEFCHSLSKVSRMAGAYVVDVGQHQMWAGQSLEIGAHQRFMTSGGMGAMGFSLPGAIGAAFSLPGTPIVVVAGDGGIQMNIQELETIKRNRLPIKIVVLNNHCLGMVRQFQESYFESRYQSTVWGYSAPDFKKISEAYGIKSECLKDPGDIREKLDALWKDPLEPFFLDVFIDPKANVYPKIAFGHPLTEMEPFVAPLDMECT